MNRFIRVCGLIVFCMFGAVIASLLAAYFFMAIVPCSFFGSAFEGGCGFGAGFAAIGIATFLMPVLSIVFVYFAFRRTPDALKEAEHERIVEENHFDASRYL